MQLFTIFILSLFLTIALVPVFKKMAFRMKIVDIPNSRKVHVHPMPKTGGISMAIGAFIPFMIWIPKDDFISAVLVASIIIVISGVVDDIKNLNFISKLVPQFIAAIIVIFWGGVRIKYIGLVCQEDLALSYPVSVALTFFVIVGVTNAINLADGLDGLAGGISMLSFVIMALLAFQCGNMPVAVMCIAVVGAIAGFLRYNTHPAVLFMGDAGSQLLGFLTIVFALVLTQTNTPYSRVLSLTLIGFPILDTLTVMVERLAKGHSPFKADTNHFHHRLLRLGFAHADAVLIIYLIQACFLSFSFVTRYYAGWTHIFLFTIISISVLGLFFLAYKTGWQFRPEGGRPSRFKRQIDSLKERKIFIRTSFGLARYTLPALLIFQCFIPEQIPKAVSFGAAGIAVVILCLRFFPTKYQRNVLRTMVCMIIPAIVYLSEANPSAWFVNYIYDLNIMAFVILIIFVLLTMRLTRRRQGFKLTTMDILIFIVILVFPNLPTTQFQIFGAGTAMAKSLALFFSFDVLSGEFRGDKHFMSAGCIIILTVLMVRGFVG